jgi:hypothetical protein
MTAASTGPARNTLLRAGPVLAAVMRLELESVTESNSTRSGRTGGRHLRHGLHHVHMPSCMTLTCSSMPARAKVAKVAAVAAIAKVQGKTMRISSVRRPH